MNGPRTLLVVVFALMSCGDDTCEEPDVRGTGQEGDPCVTIRDCVAGLTCFGDDFMADALCSSPTVLPDEADPGCLDQPDLWSGHEAHGLEPAGNDEEGCELLVFVSGCNCVDSTLGDGCLPVTPLYRRETWRRCADCCWRLVSLWVDESECEEP